MSEQPLFSTLALLLFCLSLYGWGSLAQIVLHGRLPNRHAYATGLGIVALTFIGGILNLTEVATAGALKTIGYLGIMLAVFFAIRSIRAVDLTTIIRKKNIPVAIFLTAVMGLTFFLANRLLPSTAFNYADDFMTYLDRITRMRATGAVSDNPFDLLGLAGYGADAFFQAMLMTWTPLTSVTAFDTIVCFSLGLLLLAELGRYAGCSWASISLASAVYAIINPMIVNLSSVYSTSALVLTLISAGASGGSTRTQNDLQQAIPTGLALSALIAFKTSTIFFAIPYLAVLFFWQLIRQRKQAVLTIFAIVAAGLISFAPWLLTQIDKLPTLARAHSVEIPTDPALTIPWRFAEAFLNRPTIYGSNRFDYIFALIAIASASIIEMSRLIRRKKDDQYSIVFAAASIGCLFAYVGVAGYVNNEASLRYSCPFLLTGAAIATFSMRGHFVSNQRAKFTFVPVVGVLFAQLGSLAVFANSAVARVSRIATQHTAISYPMNQRHRQWLKEVLSDASATKMTNLQAATYPGAAIFAWVDAPFHMNFRRNRILQFNQAYFVSPWRLDIANYEAVVDEFRKHEIRYVLIQYGGNSVVPQISEERLRERMWPEDRISLDGALRLLQILQQMSRRFRVVFAESGFALIDLQGH